MKSKILISLLLISSYCFGQTSVPNTETFSSEDVYTAVHAHTSGTARNLQSCFDNAISGYFNSTYNQDSYAPANSMLRFRDYKPTGSTCDYPQFAIYEHIDLSNCGTYIFSSSLTLATQACADANNNSCKTGGFSWGGTTYRIESFTIGKQIYDITGGCAIQNTTGYGVVIDSSIYYVVHTTNGIIDLKTQCYP